MKIFQAMRSNSLLLTYAAAGFVKRNLKSVGFELSHPKGANGKREMTIAYKKQNPTSSPIP
jgi:tRNA 5-methylaminomethyl-2-thiouridine biosynthesis bifunctional protein